MQTISPHRNTRAIIQAWNDMRQNGGISDRQSPSASEYPGLTDGLFLLRRSAGNKLVFRSAGQIVYTLIGEPLRGVDFLKIWRVEDRTLMDGCLSTALANQGPLLIRASADDVFEVEIFLAPLDRPGHSVCRFLGHYQVLDFAQVSPWGPVADHVVIGIEVPPARDKPTLHLVR